MTSLDSVLGALRGVPSLPGARCQGRTHLFDEARLGESADIVAARHAQALALCQRCPSLDRCGDWLTSLPPRKRPPGVIAGTIRTDDDRREAATA